jgi:hypothetical protein
MYSSQCSLLTCHDTLSSYVQPVTFCPIWTQPAKTIHRCSVSPLITRPAQTDILCTSAVSPLARVAKCALLPDTCAPPDTPVRSLLDVTQGQNPQHSGLSTWRRMQKSQISNTNCSWCSITKLPPLRRLGIWPAWRIYLSKLFYFVDVVECCCLVSEQRHYSSVKCY